MILIDKGRLYMNTISVEELEKIDSSKITIVDVRPADQYSRGSFPGAVNIPLDEFEERMESVDREKMVYVLCHTGDRSRDCVEKLSDAQYYQDVQKDGLETVYQGFESVSADSGGR